MKTKKEQAVEFISSLRTMEHNKLNLLIVELAGEELAQFFLTYAARLMSTDPDKVTENATSLMLMGYLIAKQEKSAGFDGFFPVGTPNARA